MSKREEAYLMYKTHLSNFIITAHIEDALPALS